MAMQPETLDVAPEPKFVGVRVRSYRHRPERGSIYALVANGTIRSARFGSRRLIPLEELDRFVNELRSQVK